MSLKGKLKRIKGHLSLEQKPEGEDNGQVEENGQVAENKHVEKKNQIEEKEPIAPKGTIPFLDKWSALHCQPAYFEEQYALVREVFYPLETAFGKYRYEQLEDVVGKWNEKRIAHPLSAHTFEAKDLYFFDTETTGLGGGVGNTIFLLGYSQVEDQQVKVKQFFLPDPASEIALYQAFLTDIQQMKRLVTYNGKAFDWPQVKTRHTLIREWLPKLPSFGHFDLLHASRRLWKDVLSSCRLSIVEENILGIQREEDTPGYMAPILYLDYLREQDPDIIEGIIKHNEWDVCALISLYIHISRILLQDTDSIQHIRELYEVGRWYEFVGEVEQAITVYQQLTEQDHTYTFKAKHALALLFKKTKQVHQACQLWEELSATDFSYEVDIELAKLYEHQFQDYEKALHYACKAYDHWKRKASMIRKKDQKEQIEWQKRIERLELKTFRSEAKQVHDPYSGDLFT